MNIEIDGFAGGDRTHINLPKIQEDLLKELHKTGKPIVYVNMSGSAIALNWEDENVSAIIQAFYPGETTGTALVKTLYGENNPSGRLPVTFYKSVNDLPDFKDYRMDGRTYKYFKGTPLYEFGYGLSYTTFAYSNLKIIGMMNTSGSVSVTVDVTNNGNIAGDDVVQLYFKNEGFPEITPLRSLIGFNRVSLNIGETKTVTFDINAKQLAMIDKNMERSVYPGKYTIWAGGKQPDEASIKSGKVLQANLEVSGTPVVMK